MNTPTQPTLAEIVAELRAEADDTRTTGRFMRHAADRLEALARLAQAVGGNDYDIYTMSVIVDGKRTNWFDARERLVNDHRQRHPRP